MNAPKVSDMDYIQFLIAAQRVYTCTEAARCATIASHDAYTRLLSRLPPDTAALWQEVEPLVQQTHGLLVVDDTTLDKPYAQKMGLVTPPLERQAPCRRRRHQPNDACCGRTV